MNLAIFGAKGRVGSKIVQLAKEHNVWQIDDNFETNPLPFVDVAIDFSTATATEQVVDFCKKHNCPLVTGVTGRQNNQLELLEHLSKQVTVVQKDNFCQGIQLLKEICNLVASKTHWQCEIVETHHKNKKDSPSGTAKSIASAIVQSNGSFSAVTIHSLRIGSNAGLHQVVFATEGQSLTITHQAENIDIFAKGALDCALNIAKNNQISQRY